MRKALSLSADGVEVDVYFTDVTMVIHDDTLACTTNGHGRAAEKSTSPISACLTPVQANHIPTLVEIFDAVNRRAVINVELKGPHTAAPVTALIAGYVNQRGWSYDDFCASSFDHARIREAIRLCP